MGQILSYLWKWVCPKPKNEAPISDNHQVNYEIFYHDKNNQQQSHCIDISNDNNSQPKISSLSLNEVVNNNHNNLLHPASTSHIVVGLSSNECRQQDVNNKRKKKKKEVVIDDCEQVIQQVKKVTTTKKRVSSVKKIGHYTSSQMILLVGEGDFSFSACLAIAFGASAANITATSLNSQDFLIKNYRNFLTNKAELETRGSTVLHDVDATIMLKHPIIGSLEFDRIIFNFPHSGKFGKNDQDKRTNKNLVRGFIRNAKKMLKEDGEIHITSKSSEFYLQSWDIPKIGSDQGLTLIKEHKFCRNKYPGYHTKYGFGGDKDFDCNPSKTYKFSLSKNKTR